MGFLEARGGVYRTGNAGALARSLLSFVLVAAVASLTVSVIAGAQRVQIYETDRAELNDVRYGLLDADNWVEQISEILARRIDAFELTEDNKPAVKRNIERVLDRLLVEIDAYQRRRVEAAEGWMERIRGSLRQGVQDLFIDLDDLREKVPLYAEAILAELSRPEAKEDIKAQLRAALTDLAGSTFARTDRSGYQAVLARYDCAEMSGCQSLLDARIQAARAEVVRDAITAIGLAAALFVVALYRAPGLTRAQMLVLTLVTLILLAGGITTPMIGIEAKITSLRLTLMGEPVAFANQVLYFQSKSVSDVVRVLASTGKPDMLLVAVLIALFSVVFPLAKVAASWIYFHDLRGLRASVLVRFFALKSGKWSMADVLVIAMFMAFVGFRGLVSNQLATLEGQGRTAEVLTTNGTVLEVGFYLFLAFTLASLVTSSLLDERLHEDHVT
jgi:hypothetical protein